MYAKSLGPRVSDSEMVGDRWKAQMRYRKVRVGSLELSELEMQFGGDEDAIRSFLALFRTKVQRNAG